MKKFETPRVEVAILNVEDVITTSGCSLETVCENESEIG